ncbi:SurA N-terminal domain-containing protein [Sphingobium sp. DEHP117]|uniref:peptidylprolyl isomerase n=1 Tax=Sphingobium sp. DEHP117 TaxID=2993436 RepID=UPI0027D6E34A|nr:peptidyl-prolyl cis-trans isomerase [Sphingobium sp. DEHP117]MDQ4419972.1 SurA N-terminal domain-containing protein [Sphingobium sp. DEHP117]
MIGFFRRIMGSKFGAVFALLFLATVAFAFIAGDITSGKYSSFTPFGAGTATRIGSKSLPDTEVQARVQRAFEQQRRENPGMKIDDFLSLGAVQGIYSQLVTALSLEEFGHKQGIHIGKRLIDAEIATIPAFHTATGSFSQELFRQALTTQGISEDALRKDIAQQLTGRIVAAPASFGARMTDSLVLPYASLLLEAREGRIAAIPAAAFRPTTAPTDAQLADFYKSNAARYMIPERRSFRYAIVDASRFEAAANPTESEIAAYYASRRADYAARETRDIQQLIFPIESAARAAAGAASLSAAAAASGLEVSSLKAVSKADYAKAASPAAADAAFAAPQGKVTGPVKLALGWALIQTSAVQKIAEKPLATVRPQIIETLKTQKRATLLSDFVAKVEDGIANGTTFDEAVKDNGLAVETTPVLLPTGQNVNDPAYKPSADIAPMLKAGFAMEADDDPQFVPITQGTRYALVRVGDIVAAAPPPLGQVKPIVAQHYLLSQGAAKARALAQTIQAQVAKGVPLEKAMAGAGVTLPPVQKVAVRRADLLRQDQRVPAQLSILFAMTRGSVKTMPIPEDQGTFLIQLDSVAQGDAAKVPGLVDRVRADLSGLAGNEYAEQLARAAERELGVKRNPATVGHVTKALRDANGATAPQP